MLVHSEQWAANSTTASLVACPLWGRLHARVGDGLVLRLLVHSSGFKLLGRGNYFQLWGNSVAEVSVLLADCTWWCGAARSKLLGWGNY